MLGFEEAKHYLRVDIDDDDGLIRSLVSASDNYLKSSGANPEGNEELYKLTQKLLVSHWYEQREPAGQAAELEQALRPILFKLKWSVADEPG